MSHFHSSLVDILSLATENAKNASILLNFPRGYSLTPSIEESGFRPQIVENAKNRFNFSKFSEGAVLSGPPMEESGFRPHIF